MRRLVLDGIADRNGKYNPTDVVDVRLPMRRFVVVGLDGDATLVAIEHGGRGWSVEVVLFKKTAVERKWHSLDTAHPHISFTNAGHHPPHLVRRDGHCNQLDAGGAILGASPHSIYEESEIDLTSRDWLAIYSDGLIQNGDLPDRALPADILIEILRIHPLSNASQLAAFVMAEAQRVNPSDDVMLMTIAVS